MGSARGTGHRQSSDEGQQHNEATTLPIDEPFDVRYWPETRCACAPIGGMGMGVPAWWQASMQTTIHVRVMS